jgi:hypothetical protein
MRQVWIKNVIAKEAGGGIPPAHSAVFLIYDLTSQRKYLQMSMENIKSFQAGLQCDLSGCFLRKYFKKYTLSQK